MWNGKLNMNNKLSFGDKKFLIKCWRLRRLINNDSRFFNALIIAASNSSELTELSKLLATLIRDTLLLDDNKGHYNA